MSQSQKPWCRLDVSSLIRLCDFSLSLPPQWLWLCVCLLLSSETFRVSPLMCCCSLVLLDISQSTHLNNWKKEKGKKGAVALLCTHHNCLRKCSLTLSVHLSLGCSRTHRPSSCLPEWSEVLFCLLGLRRSTFLFSLFHCTCLWSHHTARVTQFALQLWDLGHISCVCYNTCLHLLFCPPW